MRTIAAPFRNCIGFWAIAFVSIVGATACGEDDEHGSSGGATGSTCPAGNTLTYDSFGRNFMSKYCLKCHSSASTDRHGAPADHNFDTLDQVVFMADHIDKEAAAGPNATNTAMPPSGETAPSEDERKQLGQWLACETAPDDDGGGGGGGDGGDGGTTDVGGGRGDGRSDGPSSEGGRGDR